MIMDISDIEIEKALYQIPPFISNTTRKGSRASWLKCSILLEKLESTQKQSD